MTGTIWRLSWRTAVRRRRLLTWNVLVPVLLLVPVVTGGAAAAHRAVVVTVFVVFFGAYGSCIPLIRDGMSGWAEKVLLTGYGGRRWLTERTLASTAIGWRRWARLPRLAERSRGRRCHCSYWSGWRSPSRRG